MLVILVAAGLLLVIRSARDESDHGASRVLTAAPVAPAERDAVGVMRPLVVTDARPVQPMSGAHAAPAQASTDDALLCDSGLFAGVPRAWLAPLVLHGRVVDQDGAPLAGARITYLPEGSGSDLARNAGPARLRAEELEERLPSVTTAADGSFTLATARGIGLLGRERMSEITAGPALVVDDPRCAAYVHDCALGAAGDVDVGTLTVTAGAVITGRVVDASGAPLAGQHVRLETGDPETPTPGIVINVELPAALRVATTGADGSYTIRSVWPGSGWLTLETPGWLKAEVVPPWPAGGRAQAPDLRVHAPDLVAERGGAVSGTVLSADGKPMAGARVFALPADHWAVGDPARLAAGWFSLRGDGRGAPGLIVQWRNTGAVTGADGRFRIDGLQNASFALLAGADGFRPVLLRDLWPDSGDVTLSLQPDRQYARDGDIAVQVVDRAGAPIDGAFVRATMSRPDVYPGVRLPVDDDSPGTFTISGVGPLRVQVLVMARGFATTTATLQPPSADATSAIAALQPPPEGAAPAPAEIPSPPGDATTPQRIEVAPEARVEGRVVDAEGTPMPGLAVILSPGEVGAAFELRSQAVTDGEGRFSCGALRAGAWTAAVSGGDTCQASPAPLQLAEGEHRTDLVLTVTRRGALRGTWHHRDGSVPVLGPAWDWQHVVTIDAAEDSVDADRHVALGSDGSFHAEDLAPGSYLVSAPLLDPVRAEVASGETTVLELVAPRPPVVRGRVVAGGRPAPGVQVHSDVVAWRRSDSGGEERASAAGVETETVRTDADGRFTLPLLVAGRSAVWAQADSGVAGPEVLIDVGPEGEASAVELHLPAGRIEGDVIDAVTREPLAGAQVLTEQGAVTADEHGHFVADFLEAGSYALKAQATGHVAQELPRIELAADQVVSGVLAALTRAGRIDVTVVGPNGQPIHARVVVVAVPVDAAGAQAGPNTDAGAWHGHVALQDLPPAAYRVGIRAAPDDTPDLAGFVAVSLAAGETREVVLRVGQQP